MLSLGPRQERPNWPWRSQPATPSFVTSSSTPPRSAYQEPALLNVWISTLARIAKPHRSNSASAPPPPPPPPPRSPSRPNARRGRIVTGSHQSAIRSAGYESLSKATLRLTQKGGEATAETSACPKRSPGATADTRAAATNPSWSNSCIQQWQVHSSGVHHVEVGENADTSALAVSTV